MSRLPLFLLIACLVLFIRAASAASDEASIIGRHPNIIVILTDDQGYGDLSATGNPILKTPNIDKLYAAGVHFSDFHVSPTCAPTRAALMTGRHEFRNGVTHTINERERLTLDAITLPQVLKQAGYTTGIFGKWHLGDEPDHWPTRRGFDEMFIHGTGGIGQVFPGSSGDLPGNSYFSPTILHNGTFEKTNGYCTNVFFEQATKWIDHKRREDKPFFAWIATNAPHEPLNVRPEDEARYAAKVPPHTARFFGMIANIDDNVGRLMAKLAEWGMEKETLIVVMNDNGGTAGVKTFNAGMRGEKVTPWLGGTRAFSIWHWPAVLKPADVTALTAHVDLFPTLAQIAGAKLDERTTRQVDGRSLVPLLGDPSAAWPDRMLVTHVGRWPKGKAADSKYAGCSVRSSKWHLVSDADDGKKHWQLFDVNVDIGERIDIAAHHPDVVGEIDGYYDTWWATTLPMMVNEAAEGNGPKENPFQTLYRAQFGDAAK